MSKYKVWLDAGHGGTDSGAVANGLVEKKLNLVTTLECMSVLKSHNIEVGMTRTGDSSHSLSARCSMANKWKAEYFVSIHHNCASGNNGDGVEAIHSIAYGKGEELAKCIVNSIHDHTGQNLRPKPTFAKKNSSGTDYYGVIRGTSMTAVIVECAFLNSTDRYIVDTEVEQKAMGVAIAKGILKFLGVKYLGTNTTTTQAPSKPANGIQWYKPCVGSFSNEENAKDQVEKLKKEKITSAYYMFTPSVKMYRVYGGAFKERPYAEQQVSQLKSLGYKGTFIVAE